MTMSELWNTETITPTGSTVVPDSTIHLDLLSDLPKLVEVNFDGARWYKSTADEGVYPSITNVLKSTDTEGTAALKEWRNNIGHEAADNITKYAAADGVRWHKFCESFVARKPTWPAFEKPGDIPFGVALAETLNAKIKRVVASETRVCSPRLGVAGRIDMCIELWDGRYAILDFKRGKRAKTGNRLDTAALQTTFYAEAISDRLDRPVEDVVICQLLAPNQILWQETKVSLWMPSLLDRIEKFATMVSSRLETE